MTILDCDCCYFIYFAAFGVSHLAMEKLEPVGETVLIQGSSIKNNFNLLIIPAPKDL